VTLRSRLSEIDGVTKARVVSSDVETKKHLDILSVETA
jgi:hypothetical protein